MSLIGDVIDEFDGSDELAQLQRETVEALAALGQSKGEAFDLEIKESLLSAGNGTNLTVPVSSVLRSLIDLRAYSSTEVGKIGEVVKDALSRFISGAEEDIIEGIGSLISDTLAVFLGEASASTGTIEEYYVATEGLSIIRVDMKAWYLNVSAESIRSKMERATSIVAIKSVVDLAKVDFSTFLNLYQQMLGESKLSPEQISKALDEARRIYKEFEATGGTAPTEPAWITDPPAALALKRAQR